MSAFGRDRFASELETALEGGPIRSAQTGALADLARELRDAGLTQAPPAISPMRRDELMAAVAERRRARLHAGTHGRFRGASLGLAVVAGGGLVVASAATGSTPAALVVDVAREVPRIAHFQSPPSADVSIEGEVVASRDNGRTLEVRTDNETIVVESPRQTRDVTAEGTPIAAASISEGTTIRVTSNRETEGGVVPATKIEVLPTASTAMANPDTASARPPDVRPTNDAAPANTTPRPSPAATKTPATSLTPKTNTTSVAVVPVEPTRTPTPKPTATPTPTQAPKRTSTPAPVANETNNVEAETDAAAAPSFGPASN